MMKMITTLRRLLASLLPRCDGTAAVEAAIFLPIFMLLTFGITDIGSSIFVRQQVNAAAQAGATYAVINSGASSLCASLSADCLTGIRAAMNAAAGNPSFCTDSGCNAAITGCADGSPKCINVSADYVLIPILPSVTYSWAQSMTITSTVTIRIS